MQKKKQAIENDFLNPDLSAEEIESKSKELGEIQEQIEFKEMRWFELSEKLEG